MSQQDVEVTDAEEVLDDAEDGQDVEDVEDGQDARTLRHRTPGHRTAIS